MDNVVFRTSSVAGDPPATSGRAVHSVLVRRHVCCHVWNMETVLKPLHQILHWLCVWVNIYKKKEWKKGKVAGMLLDSSVINKAQCVTLMLNTEMHTHLLKKMLFVFLKRYKMQVWCASWSIRLSCFYYLKAKQPHVFFFHSIFCSLNESINSIYPPSLQRFCQHFPWLLSLALPDGWLHNNWRGKKGQHRLFQTLDQEKKAFGLL